MKLPKSNHVFNLRAHIRLLGGMWPRPSGKQRTQQPHIVTEHVKHVQLGKMVSNQPTLGSRASVLVCDRATMPREVKKGHKVLSASLASCCGLGLARARCGRGRAGTQQQSSLHVVHTPQHFSFLVEGNQNAQFWPPNL